MGNRHVICSSNPVDVDLYTLRVGDDAQRANGKKSDSKPEERISKRHSLPPGVRRRYIANYRDGSRRALECVFKSAAGE